MPDYGLRKPEQGVLSFRWARERLERAHNYWVATVTRQGRPHSMPVWGVWLDDAYYFDTAPGSRKARNLLDNPACTVASEPASEAVVLEGTAAVVNDRERISRVHAAYQTKYAQDQPPPGVLFEVRPHSVFAFAENDLRGTATRWRFDSPSK